MRQRGGKLVQVTAMAIEWLRATAGPQSVNSGKEGRCELFWRPEAPMPPSRRSSDRALRSSPIVWKEVHRDAEFPNLEMLVPQLGQLEVANVVLVGERRGRCSQADTTQWLAYLGGLPIVLDGETETRAWSDTVSLTRQHGLTAYDAAYLELALREYLPIATLDAKLKGVAQALGVAIFQP